MKLITGQFGRGQNEDQTGCPTRNNNTANPWWLVAW